MNIKSTKVKVAIWIFLGVFLFLFSSILALAATSSTSAASQSQLPDDKLEMFAQNNILFYDPSQCIGGGKSSGICGSNTKEKLWTALRQHFDEIHAAAALGNILHEGGLNPLRWEYRVVSSNPPAFTAPVDDWNKLYDGTYIKRCYNEEWDYCIGVGDFAITWYLDEYLHYIEENEPDLFDYFKDPKYTYMEGDSLIDELGEDIYDRLIALEVKYFIEEWLNPDTKKEFENYTDVTEAARYYSRAIMACELCKTESVMSARAASAEEMYDELKGFSCTPKSGSSNSSGSSASSGTVSGNSITWIGDSYSENSANKAAVEAKYPGIYYNGQSGRMFANDSNRWGASGLNIIGNEIKDDLRDYLVFALGTNTDAASKEDMTKNIDDLVATVKKYNSNTKIILVSPITNNDSTRSIYDAYHEAMQEAVEKYDNVILADWYDAAKDHLDEYFDDHSTGAYTDNSTHPNTKGYGKWIETISNALSSAAGNGCTTYDGEYPQYDQCGDPRWSNYSYSTDNICGSGCGAASMAMLATVATGQDIFPDDIAKLLGNQYYDSVSVHTLDPIVGEHYGFEVIKDSSSTEEETKTKFRQYLKDGYMIHFTGAGHFPGFYPLPDGSDSRGHVIGLFDIDSEDNVTQANSGWGNQKVSLDDMAKAKTWPEFTAIKGNGSKNDCNNLCNNISNDSFASLNEEQAQKIADYYNSNEVTAENFIGGYIPSDCSKMNCVSFSLWFVSAFTDAAEISPTPSLVGNGSYIADTGLPSIGWETGNDPTPYSVFGGAGSSAWSHTGVVVGTTDDGNILTIEAAYVNHGLGCVGWDAQVTVRDPSYFSEGFGILAYPGSHLTPNEGHLGNKSLNEIIGS